MEQVSSLEDAKSLAKKRSVSKEKKFQQLNRQLIVKRKSERDLVNQLDESGKLIANINITNTMHKKMARKFKKKSKSSQEVIDEKNKVITLTLNPKPLTIDP